MIQLHNADCADILKIMPDESVNLIVTDPPYEMHVRGGGVQRIFNIEKGSYLGDIEASDIHNGYDFELNKEFVRIMRGINIYIWCNKLQIPAYFDYYVNELGCHFDILTWHKNNATPNFNMKYNNDTEYCLHFAKNSYGVRPDNYEDATTYYISAVNQSDKKKYGHPTIKPLEIIERIIRNSSRPGDVVFDPFMGSGTTGVACKDLERSFIGVEIDEKWYNVAKQRIDKENATVDNSIALDLSQYI